MGSTSTIRPMSSLSQLPKAMKSTRLQTHTRGGSGTSVVFPDPSACPRIPISKLLSADTKTEFSVCKYQSFFSGKHYIRPAGASARSARQVHQDRLGSTCLLSCLFGSCKNSVFSRKHKLVIELADKSNVVVVVVVAVVVVVVVVVVVAVVAVVILLSSYINIGI